MARSGFLRRVDRSAGETGQSLVELGLAISFFTLLLLGAIQMAQFTYAAIQVSNAAAAGVQYGAQNGGTAGDTSGIQAAASADSSAPGLSGLVANSSFSCVCSDGTASTCANTDCSNSRIEETLTVNTSATFNAFIHVPGLPSSITMTGQAIQKCGQ